MSKNLGSEDFFKLVGTSPKRDRDRSPEVASDSPIPVALDEIKTTNVGGSSWASSGDVFWRVGKNYSTLPPGIYRCEISSSMGPIFLSIKNDTDTLIRFPDSESYRLIEEMTKFQGMRDKFQHHGFLHKRGILLWGPPGGGKTTTVQLLIDLVVRQHGGVAVFIDRPSVAVACLQMLRAVEPERQIVGILEDLDALVDRFGESEYLALLDGESQVDRVIYVATSNYPERLDARFVDRPSRIDTVRYIGMPSEVARRMYFSTKVPELTELEVQEYVDASKDYSIAHMRELIILTRCFEVPLSEAKQRLDGTKKRKPSSADAPNKHSFGFAA